MNHIKINLKVGILSRRRKRFILNEKELVAATLALGK